MEESKVTGICRPRELQAIVNILEKTQELKENLTAAGRGEFAPIMSNDTPEGKGKP